LPPQAVLLQNAQGVLERGIAGIVAE